MTILNLDLDGVVYDFVGKFKEWFTSRNDMSDRRIVTPTHWHFYEDWGLSKNQFDHAVGLFASDGGFRDDRRVDMDLVRELNAIRRDHDLRVRVVSHKNSLQTPYASMVAMQDTIAMLCRVDLDVDDYVFVGNTASKADYPCDFAIDDNPDVDTWAAGSRANYLWAQPWNMRKQRYETFRRVNSLHHLREELAR